MRFDPDKATNNLSVITSGDETMNVTDLRLAAVRGVSENGETTRKALVASGEIEGLPSTLTGTVNLPSTMEFTTKPGDPLTKADLRVRNFVLPDDLPETAPSRTQFGDPQHLVSGGEQDLQLVQRGERFKGHAVLQNLVAVGYHATRDADNNALDARAVTAEFDGDTSLHTYVDLIGPDPKNPGTDRAIIGDVLLSDLAARTEVCFRGPKTAAATPVNAGWCDETPANEEMAFRVVSDPEVDTSELDVDATIRLRGGDGKVLSARAVADNIPHVVQALIEKGAKTRVRFNGFDSDGTTPNGIDRLRVQAADRDVPEHGFGDNAPWAERAPLLIDVGTTPTEPQFAVVRSSELGFFAHAEIGAIEGEGDPGSNVHTLLVDDQPCDKPSASVTDYPHYPSDLPGAEYQCFKVAFDEANGGSDDPFGVDVHVESEGKLIQLADAGFTNLPQVAQATIAKAPSLEGDELVPIEDRPFRRQCGTTAQEEAYLADPDHEDAVSCTPPMIRVDTSGDSVLYGRATVGPIAAVKQLAGIKPHDTATDLNIAPGADGAGWSDWGDDPFGVRATLSVGEPDGSGESPLAFGAGLRLNLPRSLTIDRPLTWNGSDEDAGTTKKDVIVALHVNDEDGPVDSIGQVAALIELSDGRQFLLSDGGDDYDAAPSDTAGMDVPGDFRFALYTRDNAGDIQAKIPATTFTQIDGRVNKPLDLRVRIQPPPDTPGEKPQPVGNIDARAINLPATDDSPAFTDNPQQSSFRIRKVQNAYSKRNPDLAQDAIDKENQTKDLAQQFNMTWEEAQEVGASCKAEKKSNRACTLAQVKIVKIDAVLDFRGDTDKPVRNVDLTVATFKKENAVQVRGSGAILGVPAEPGNTGKLDAGVHLDVDPLTVIHSRGIPWLGQLQLALVSTAKADLVLKDSNYARLRLTGPHFDVEADNDDGADTKVTIAPKPTVFDMLITAIGLPLYSVHLIHNVNPMVIYACDIPFKIPEDKTTVDATYPVADYVVLPHRLKIAHGGILAALGPVAFHFVPLGMCANGKWEIRDGLLPNAVSPLTDSTHPVPGSFNEPPPPPIPDPAPKPKLVFSGEGTLCGNYEADSGLEVKEGGTLHIGCDGAENTTITVDGPVQIDGTVLIDRAELQATIAGTDITVGPTGKILYNDTVGRLSLEAQSDLVIEGEVNARGVIDAAPPADAATKGGGAGHYAVGGTPGGADNGEPGDSYANDSLEPTEDENDQGIPTTPGSGGPNSFGGGEIRLRGDLIRIPGVVTAQGGEGLEGDNNADHCPDGSDPGPIRGAGGGSGGTILLVGREVNLNGGEVNVRGGAGLVGTAGGGGGGSGGVIKVRSPIYKPDGGALLRGGGDPGANACADLAEGTAGGDGEIITELEPSSSATAFGGTWTRGLDVDLPITTGAAITDASNDIEVVACGVRTPPENGLLTEEDGGANYGIELPTSASVTNPCGDGGTQLGAAAVVTGEKSGENDTMPIGDLPAIDDSPAEGWWGIYTVAFKPGLKGEANDNRCLDPTDAFDAAADAEDCVVESLPTTPDVIVGVDRTKPTIDATFGNINIGRMRTVKIVSATDTMTGDNDEELTETSGVVRKECSNDQVTWLVCDKAINAWKLTGSDGEKHVWVRSTDAAGNLSNKVELTTKLDTGAPTSEAHADSAPPAGHNDWYVTAPSFTINNFQDPGGIPGTPRYRWWFDDNAPTTCDGAECHVPAGQVGRGQHEFHWQAIDTLDHAEPPQTLPFKVDADTPASHLDVLAPKPQGANGWYQRRPLIVVSAVDQLGGSGIGDNAVRLKLNDVPTDGNVPVELGPGTWNVCWSVVDNANNESSTQCLPKPIKVDDVDPSVEVAANPALPDGTNDWYVSDASVQVTQSDAAPGSGYLAAYVDGLTALCAGDQEALALLDHLPNGMCVSVDGLPYKPYAGPTAFGRGTHVLRAFSVDASGRRSEVVPPRDQRGRCGSGRDDPYVAWRRRTERMVATAAACGHPGGRRRPQQRPLRIELSHRSRQFVAAGHWSDHAADWCDHGRSADPRRGWSGAVRNACRPVRPGRAGCETNRSVESDHLADPQAARAARYQDPAHGHEPAVERGGSDHEQREDHGDRVQRHGRTGATHRWRCSRDPAGCAAQRSDEVGRQGRLAAGQGARRFVLLSSRRHRRRGQLRHERQLQTHHVEDRLTGVGYREAVGSATEHGRAAMGARPRAPRPGRSDR